VTLHVLLPLAALVLNISLVVLCVLRNPGSRLNRVFAYFGSAMALWNFGVFMLRRAPDVAAAWRWEVVIHVGVIVLPALYYHFVLIFLDSTSLRRRWLGGAYGIAAVFSAANLTDTGLFMSGVRWTDWGWAPMAGPLYHAFFVYFYVLFVAGLVHLVGAYRRADSGFRRNRILLILLGTSVTILGGFTDILRFMLAGVLPGIERVYPMGIPTNMACAVTLGIAIVRYRMFDVSVLVKKVVVYGAVGTVATAGLVGLTWVLRRALALDEVATIWMIAPLGFVFTLLLTPLGRPVEDWIEHLMFSRPRGCHETLLELSKRMATILDLDRLVDTLVVGLVRGIPLTHCALLLRDDASNAFVVRREESSSGEATGVLAVPATSRLAQWLATTQRILVKEEALINRRLARYFEPAAGELEALNASLVVPLRIERGVTGILLLGEKLSGEIFGAQDLEVLSVLANQAAISLENARLYEQADRERRRITVLYQVSRRLATVGEPDETLALIVTEAARVLGTEVAALRLLEGGELVLKARTGAVEGVRARLAIGESLTGLVVERNEPLMVEDVLEEPRCDPAHRQAAKAAGLHAFLGVPVRAAGRAIGVLYVFGARPRRFGGDEVSLLTALADHVSVAVERGRLAAERRQAEDALRQSEKLATMGQLLAGVAHELNNPLTVIVGFAGLLAAKLAGGPLGDSAQQITAAAERCGRIVRNFLALARKHPPERKRVSLNQIVTDAVELLAYPLGADGVTTTLDLGADLPPLWADQHQLQQVVVNLLTNAHHALRDAPERRLTLATRYDRAQGRVLLRVADTGPGIPPEIQGRIFEPFFTTKPVGQGTGLGLSLCHGIVEGHGGSIRVESLPGRGAVFTVELPVERPAGDEGPAPAAPPPPAVAGLRVLVLDDEPAVTRLLEQFLSLDGHQVTTVCDAVAAREMLERDRHDLIICDIRMPGLDGPGLYREVTRRWPAARPRFIFMTGDVLGAETRRFLEETGAPCLSKPFVLDDVRRIVHLAVHELQGDRLECQDASRRPERISNSSCSSSEPLAMRARLPQ